MATRDSINGVPAARLSIGSYFPYENKLFVNKVIDQKVVWEEVKDTSEVKSEFLDIFQPAKFVFFIVGNAEDSEETREAIKVAKYVSNNFKVWSTGDDCIPEDFTKRCWLDRERLRDDLYGRFKGSTHIWHRGEFVGGLSDMKRALRDELVEFEKSEN